MNKGSRIAGGLWWILVAGAAPAYANNPPAPDGMLSLLLVFPVAILGFRLAGAKFTEKEKKWRILRGVLLALCTLAAAAGTGVGGLGMLVLLSYGLLRGAQAMGRGQGGRRFALGAFMILFAFFAGANYLTSLNNWPSVLRSESSAVGAVRTIVTAETTFRADKKLDANKNGIPEYGTPEQLHQAGLIPDSYRKPGGPGGYRLVVVLTGDPAQDEKEFFVYATPDNYGSPPAVSISLVEAIRPQRRFGLRSFAADETGEIREADLGGSRAVTRAVAQKWKKLSY